MQISGMTADDGFSLVLQMVKAKLGDSQ